MAELRGWTAISERIGVSQAEHALAETLDHALTALTERGGRDVTLEGDATQPAVSCTFGDPDSPMTALRAAVGLRLAVAEAQSPAPPEHQFRVGMGLDAGNVTTVTSDDGVSFESVGPIRMFAAKLRDFAGSGQIFMSAAVYLDARDLAHVQSLGQVRVNAYGDTREAFSLTDMQSNEP
jgi:class 3 adenylate cyclase